MTRVAVLDDYQRIAASMAAWSCIPEGDVEFFYDYLPDEDTRVQRLQPFDVIVAMRERTPFTRGLIDRLPNLKLLITTGMGNASFDMAALKQRGIVVCGTGGQRTATAELAWGLILALVRNIAYEDAAMRAGGWQTTIGPSLDKRVLGVIGLGRLGSQVAGVGRAFGMEVIAWSRNLTPERAAEHGVRLVTKDQLLAQSDVVSIHVGLSDSSRGLIGARELALMRPDAYLVNTSRGPIVDEAALIDALESKRIAGAALDVYDIEPLPADHRLRRTPNTVLTPHLGYVTTDSYRIFYGDALENILAFLNGAPTRVIEAR